MISLSEQELLGLVSEYVYPFFRYGAFFMAAPIFGTKIVSMRVRVVLSLALTLLLVPLLPPFERFDGVSVTSFIVVTHQIIIGIALGFVLQVMFQVFVLAGQYIAMKMGLGFASMNDPSSGVSVTILSQFYLLTASLLFLSINGHLKIISMLHDSFIVLPVSTEGLSIGALQSIINLGGWMFSSALTIALPVLTALLLVNIAFGIVNRAAPQMNIFAVGFPITLMLGMLIMWVSFPSFETAFVRYIEQGISYAENIMEIR